MLQVQYFAVRSDGDFGGGAGQRRFERLQGLIAWMKEENDEGYSILIHKLEVIT